jgi:hypothetical protein
MRKCSLHVGTHRTGSTSIQHLLSANTSALQERGYFYPRSGQLPDLPGHHNLAWEISGDRRFRESAGTIDDLMREMRSRPEHIILSSEDFGTSLDHEAKFSAFISFLQSSGFLVTIIVYLRNQIDYLLRSYLALLPTGWDLGWRESLFNLDHREMLRRLHENGDVLRGYLILHEAGVDLSQHDSIFDADYCELLRRVCKNANVEVIVRSYDQARTSICRDFLSIFKLTLGDLRVDGEVWVNVSPSLREYLLMFLRNRIGRRLLENEEAAVNRLVSSEAREIRLSAAAQMELFQRFREDNRTLFLHYGIPEPRIEDISRVNDSSETPYVDELFSENIESVFLKPEGTR